MTNTDITCKPSSTYTYDCSGSYPVDYYSAIYIVKTSQDITIDSTSNSFSKCFKATNGGIFNLDPGSADIIFEDSLSSYNEIGVDGKGGAFYGKTNCNELSFSDTTYDKISSCSDGGVFYAKITDTSFSMTNIKVTNTKTNSNGGFAFLE